MTGREIEREKNREIGRGRVGGREGGREGGRGLGVGLLEPCRWRACLGCYWGIGVSCRRWACLENTEHSDIPWGWPCAGGRLCWGCWPHGLAVYIGTGTNKHPISVISIQIDSTKTLVSQLVGRTSFGLGLLGLSASATARVVGQILFFSRTSFTLFCV